MRLRVSGSFFGWFEMTSGVLRGLVLGPLLYLLYVNDLPDLIINSMKMFADDTKIWKKTDEENEHGKQISC